LLKSAENRHAFWVNVESWNPFQVRKSQLMLKLFDTVTDDPLNAGTWARRNTEATQPPTGVPANDPLTVAVVARPLGAKVTVALPLPVGPPGFLQLAAPDAAALNAEIADALLNGGASAGGGVSTGGFFAASVFTAIGLGVATTLALAAALALGAALALAAALALSAGLSSGLGSSSFFASGALSAGAVALALASAELSAVGAASCFLPNTSIDNNTMITRPPKAPMISTNLFFSGEAAGAGIPGATCAGGGGGGGAGAVSNA
jgi:hypothetical protein